MQFYNCMKETPEHREHRLAVMRAYGKKHYAENPEYYTEKHQKRIADPVEHAKLNAYFKDRYKKRKMKVIKHYSPDMCCAYCGDDWYPCLTVDHINGDGCIQKKTKKQNVNMSSFSADSSKWPKDIQILCGSCNSVKRNMNDKEFRQAYPERIKK